MDKTEAVARAIDPGAWVAWIYDDVSPSKEERQNTARKNAWSAISAVAKSDADNGLVTLPRKPTEAMRKVVAAQWGRRTWDEYQAVIDAATQDGEGG